MAVAAAAAVAAEAAAEQPMAVVQGRKSHLQKGPQGMDAAARRRRLAAHLAVHQLAVPRLWSRSPRKKTKRPPLRMPHGGPLHLCLAAYSPARSPTPAPLLRYYAQQSARARISISVKKT